MDQFPQVCIEQHQEFIVLDWPNQFGGERVEGMPLEPHWISFMEQLSVPYVDGMTIGEIALMTNAKRWMGALNPI